MRTVVKLLEEGLGLKVHPDKTKIVDNLVEPFIFLGYVFKQGYYHSPSDKAVKKFKKRIKDVTKRNQTLNLEEFLSIG
ncbi:hypothetical protein R4Z09_10015 [Niallia oryzisoli]|uniref:Reverse transcriptase n=1 Tax=Niallia oryzisoli TaxID=1737571 RepID=A0ABZ2CHX8_9BACI